MFLGEYITKFSGSGRVILPKKLRLGLKTEVIILSRGFDGCIWGYSKEEFEKLAKAQLEVSATEERGRQVRRYLFASSEPAELDSQGRFIIPSALLTYAKLREMVVIIGAGDHFEIWDENSWKLHLGKLEEEYARIS